MKFSKIYTEWVTYLKKKGIYGQYMLEYSRVNEYLTCRTLYREHRIFVTDSSNHKFLNSRDLLVGDKSDENMTFEELMDGIRKFRWNTFFPSKYNWREILEDFGVEFGYYERPRRLPDEYGLWSDYDISSSHRVTRSTNVDRYRGREEANIGQWYDVYYNRGRRERVNNNFINNVRWRR